MWSRVRSTGPGATMPAMTKPSTSTRLTMPEAAARLQWSVRFLKRRLAAHGIAPIGKGKAARVTEEDMADLEAKERTPCGPPSTSLQEIVSRPVTSVTARRSDRELAAMLRRSSKERERR